MTAGAAWREVRFRSRDGLELFARDYGPEDSPLVPVLCLSGLTRNSKDAHALASRLAGSELPDRRAGDRPAGDRPAGSELPGRPTGGRLAGGRRVIAPDYRGRGRSEYAADPSSYRIDVEMADAVDLLDRLDIGRVAVVGTSRGGLIAVLMAVHHRARLAGVVLNDIGPELEADGLVRIGRYLGRTPRFKTWRGAVAALRRTNPGFESLSEAEWLAFARRVFAERDGRPVLDYDPALRRIFPSPAEVAAGAVAPAWELFACLEGLPVAALRGEHSDLLSPATHARMATELTGLDAVTVSHRGHAPFLDEPESFAAVDRLLARCQDTPPAAAGDAV